MISICTVIVDGMDSYLSVFLDSVSNNLKKVTEVVVVKINENHSGFIDEYDKNGVIVKNYGLVELDPNNLNSRKWQEQVYGHAFGIHYAIDKSSNGYVMISDPDIFFFCSVDSIYLDLMLKYDLDVIGISHFNSKNQSYLTFPCITNLLISKRNLPDRGWLREYLYGKSGMRNSDNCKKLTKFEGKFLIPGPIEEFYKRFPNPDGIFDAGCNLWLWSDENKFRWMSFLLNYYEKSFENNYGTFELVYPLNYNLERYDTNFGLDENLGNLDLLYHMTGGAKRNMGTEFVSLYEKLFGKLT